MARHANAAAKELETETAKAATKNAKRAFWSRGSSATSENAKPQTRPAITEAPKAKRGWVSKFSKSYQQDQLNASNTPLAKPVASTSTNANKQPGEKGPAETTTGDAHPKKSWLPSFASRTPKEPKVPKAPKAVANKPDKAKLEEPTARSVRRGLFGMLDGLKLKPPTDESAKRDSAPLTKPVPIKPGQQMPSTQSESDDDDGDDDYSGRPMSKADRKKLRRQNQDDRRAA